MVLVASLGITIGVSSASWFHVWVGMEFAMMSYVGFMSSKGESYQKLIIYFIAQVFGSFVLLIGAMSPLPGAISLVLLGITFKLGFVGGHIWASGFVGGLSSWSLMWFLVIMKVGPLAIFMGSLPLVVTAILTTLIGLSYMGISSSVQEYLFWSGLISSSWLLLAWEARISWEYFCLYSLVVLWMLSSSLLEEFYVFSFAGVPPLALFFGKVMVLMSVSWLSSVYLVLLACASLVYYSRWLSRVSRSPEHMATNQMVSFSFVLLSR